MRLVRPLVRVLVPVLAMLLVAPTTAHADPPPFVAWTPFLPALAPGYSPLDAHPCPTGGNECPDGVIAEMYRRWQPLSDTCNHNALFALTYLRTTEEYRRSVEDPHFFHDNGFVNNEDVVFGGYYFKAYDDWYSGNVAAVPPAWQIAFQAADSRSISGYGNLLLGMNAHINRDLAFVLYRIGLVAPDGASRKPDHDQVNVFLNRVSETLFPELARRYDPTITQTSPPKTAASPAYDFASFQLIPEWREMAWRHAEQLANAPDADARARIADDIENYAASQAEALMASSMYWPAGNSHARDAYCAVHHNDA